MLAPLLLDRSGPCLVEYNVVDKVYDTSFYLCSEQTHFRYVKKYTNGPVGNGTV